MQETEWKSKRYLGFGVKNSQNQKKKHTNNQPTIQTNRWMVSRMCDKKKQTRWIVSAMEEKNESNVRIKDWAVAVAWSAAVAKSKPSF